MKKWRLNIPDKVRRCDAHAAFSMNGKNGDVIPLEEVDEYYYMYKKYYQVPKDWLEPIQDEPVSAEEVIKKSLKAVKFVTDEPSIEQFTYNELLAVVKEAEANNELRHQRKQSFEEWFEKNKVWLDCKNISKKQAERIRGD